jgi:hypothetical protein
MMERTQWILFFAVVGCALTGVAIALLVRLHKLHKRHGSTAPGDIRPIANSIDKMGTEVHDSRVESAAASEGIRQQLDVNQTTNEMELKSSGRKLGWIKATIERWFSTPPRDDDKKP